MASAEKKRKGGSSSPDWVAKYLKCPVCLRTIKDPPIYLCERGHELCCTCRGTLKDQSKPCPVCRGRLTDVRSLAVEKMLEDLPKIKCKNKGCSFKRSDPQLVKRHEDEECREKLVECHYCLEPIALSKLFGHVDTQHEESILKNLRFGEWWDIDIQELDHHEDGFLALGKVSNNLGFFFNWVNYDMNLAMFWISFWGRAKEAEKYDYSLVLKSSVDNNVASTNLLCGQRECVSCDMSHEEVKKQAKGLLFPHDLMDKAVEGQAAEEKWTGWTLVINKK